MKITSPQGKGLLERFKEVKVGQSCVFPSPLPALSNTMTQAFLVSRKPGKEWEFRLFWYGVEIGSAKAEIKGDELILEVL
jgi:hypothetical protein